MASVISRHNKGDGHNGKSVLYSPCNRHDVRDEHCHEYADEDSDLDEITILDRKSDQDEITIVDRKQDYSKENSQYDDDEYNHEFDEIEEVINIPNNKISANGPDTSPGIALYNTITDRAKLIGQRLSSSGDDGGSRINLESRIYADKMVQQKPQASSKANLFEQLTSRLKIRHHSKPTDSGDNIHWIQLNQKTPRRSTETITSRVIRKQRRKDIEERFGKGSHKHEGFDASTSASDKDSCRWTFLFDPAGRLMYWWSFVVSIAFLYNFWVMIYRFTFAEINTNNMAVWLSLDYTADLVYVLDVVVHFRTCYLEEGVLQTDTTKIRLHYMNTTMFYIDCLCCLPLDFLYLSIGFRSMVRCFRLVKIYRFWDFLDKTERHTNYPNVFRTGTLLHYIVAIFHWNACVFYLIIRNEVLKDNVKDTWGYPDEDENVIKMYLHSLWWSTQTLTTFGNLPPPRSIVEYFFVIFQLVFALLLFATVLGHVANIVANVSAARKEFQAKLDGVKTFMSLRHVPLKVQDRVIKWFDYLWQCNKSSDEEKILRLLPDRLKAEIAIHVHLDTLKRVEIFQNTEAGFLCELVLRLRPALFSPGDYICRKGEVGKDMYIVNKGRLQVVGDNGKTVYATLKAGSYFGEISILNMGTAGNRRTASVRSVGYSDLFCLNKNDLWDVLRDYPTARVRLEAIAVKRLEKYKKVPLEQENLKRCKSTPALIETAGKTSLPAVSMLRHHGSIPAGLLGPSLPAGHEDGNQSLATTSTNSDNNADVFQSDNNAPACNQEFSGISSSSTSHATNITTVNTNTSASVQPSISLNVTRCEEPCDMPNLMIPNPYMLSPNYLNTVVPMVSREGIQYNASHMFPSLNSCHSLHSPTAYGSHGPTLLVPVNSATSSSNVSLSPESSAISTDTLMNEITRLRERLASVESVNVTLNTKLSEQQLKLESRMTEIEMQICDSNDSTSSPGSIQIEVQKESII